MKYCEFSNTTTKGESIDVNPRKVISKNGCYMILKKYIVSCNREPKTGFCHEVRLKHDSVIHPFYCEDENYHSMTNDLVTSINFALRHYKKSLFDLSLAKEQYASIEAQLVINGGLQPKPKRIRRTFKELEQKKAHFCFYKHCKKAFTTRKA